jgi:hypothetical protein
MSSLVKQQTNYFKILRLNRIAKKNKVNKKFLRKMQISSNFKIPSLLRSIVMRETKLMTMILNSMTVKINLVIATCLNKMTNTEK